MLSIVKNAGHVGRQLKTVFKPLLTAALDPRTSAMVTKDGFFHIVLFGTKFLGNQSNG